MRLLSATLIGIKGIYAKSGIGRITIDFTKCIHNLIVVVGENGSGKSTLLQVLNPLPEPASMYLDKQEGYKEIDYINDDVIYKIIIRYPVNAKGERLTTKAFFQEIKNGELVELNPNGNIGSFRDVVYSKFNLDSNFSALSQLSVENRGIVDRTPSERKKFVGPLIESIEAYNDIYKALVKRSTIFKSITNSIVTKIDAIGDGDKLRLDLDNLSRRIDQLANAKSISEQEVANARATISILDPDNMIRARCSDLFARQTKLNEAESMVRVNIDRKDGFSYKNSKSVENALNELKKRKTFIEYEIDRYNAELSNSLSRRDEEVQMISLKQSRISSLQSDYNVQDLKNRVTRLKKNVADYMTILNNMGFDGYRMSSDEYIIAVNTLIRFREAILAIRSQSYESDISTAVYHIKNNISVVEKIEHEKTVYEGYKKQESAVRQHIIGYKELVSKLDILNKRPKSCKNDKCEFIKSAVEAQKVNPSAQLAAYERTLDNCLDTQDHIRTVIKNWEEISNIVNRLDVVLRDIQNSKPILDKLPNMGYLDRDVFLDRIDEGNSFDDINQLSKSLQYANILELYRVDNETLLKLETEYIKHKDNVEIIEELSKEISNLNNRLSGIVEEIDVKEGMIRSYNIELASIGDDIDSLEFILKQYTTLDTILEERKLVRDALEKDHDNINKIDAALVSLKIAESNILSLENDLAPARKKLDTIRYSLSKLDEYKAELATYENEYKLVELVKKYSSPTNGIQTLFMKLYMDNTLVMANKLLSLFFKGELQLLPYIINESEFRIPSQNMVTSMINDDISSCSTAERSIIAVIMSFTLMRQGSSIYNILKLDEIDGNLDQSNKTNFIPALDIIKEELGVEHFIMVSHSSEINLAMTDIISLSQPSEPLPGNVIFQL